MEELKSTSLLLQHERRKEKRKMYRLQQKLKEKEMSEEERQQLKNKRYLARQAYLSKMSKEQLEEQRIKAKVYRKQYWDNLSEDKKKRVGERVMGRLKNLEGDQLEKQREIGRKAVRKYHDKLKEKDGDGYREMIRENVRKRWEWFKEYQRDRVKLETEEEREGRLLRLKINDKKRKARREEMAWRGEEEMKRRLEEVEEEVREKWREEKEETMRESSNYKERMEARKPKRKRMEVTMTMEENLEGMLEEVAQDEEEEIFSGNLEETQCLSVTTTTHHGYHQEEHVLRLTPFLEIVGVVGAAEVDEEGNPSNHHHHPEVSWGGDLEGHSSLVEILPSFVQDDGGLNSGIFMVVLEAPPTPPPLPPTPPPYFILEGMEEEEPIPTPPSSPTPSPLTPEPPHHLPEKEENLVIVKPFICEICGNQFSTARGVRDHKNKQHNPSGGTLICPECSKKLGGPQSLWRHFSKYHLGPPTPHHPHHSKEPQLPITCEYCHKSVIRGYQQHLQKKHPERYIPPNKLPDGRLKCPYCPTQLKSEIVLNKHLKYKHGDKDDKRGDDKPNNIFYNLERKLEARQLIKMDSKSAWCLVCKPPCQLANAWISIKTHFVIDHHEILKDIQNMAIFSCQLCNGHGYSTQEYLLKHLKDNHPNEIFQCLDCPIIKMTRKELRIHQAYHRKVLRRTTQLGFFKELEKEACKPMPVFWRGGQQANKFIKEKLNNLKVHCPECDSVVKCKLLERHLKRKHDTVPEHMDADKLSCQMCDKQLPSLLYLYAHSHLIHNVPLEQLIKFHLEEKDKLYKKIIDYGMVQIKLQSKYYFLKTNK